jgi:hypothetical protein
MMRCAVASSGWWKGLAVFGRKRKGHLWVNFDGGLVVMTLTEKRAAAVRSGSNSDDGRLFDDQRWTSGNCERRRTS